MFKQHFLNSPPLSLIKKGILLSNNLFAYQIQILYSKMPSFIANDLKLARLVSHCLRSWVVFAC